MNERRSGDGGGPGSHPFVHKIHVPIETSPGAVLHVDGVDFHLETGHACEVDNLVPHGAFNRGETDRIHLVFEVFDGGEMERFGYLRKAEASLVGRR